MSENQKVENAGQGLLGPLSANGCAWTSLASAALGGGNLALTFIHANQGRSGLALFCAGVAAFSATQAFKYAHTALKISASDAVAAEKAMRIPANENGMVIEPSRVAEPR